MSGLLFLDYKKDSKYFEGMFNIKKNMKTAVTKLETLAPSLGKTLTFSLGKTLTPFLGKALTPSLGKTKQIIWSWLGGSPAFFCTCIIIGVEPTWIPEKGGGGRRGIFPILKCLLTDNDHRYRYRNSIGPGGQTKL